MFQELHAVLYGHNFPHNGRASFEAHYARVRELVPADRLLEYHVSQGWVPLCEFLDKPVPSEEGTPFINNTAQINDKLGVMHVENLKAQGKRVLDICAYAALTWSIVKALRIVVDRATMLY